MTVLIVRLCLCKMWAIWCTLTFVCDHVDGKNGHITAASFIPGYTDDLCLLMNLNCDMRLSWYVIIYLQYTIIWQKQMITPY